MEGTGELVLVVLTCERRRSVRSRYFMAFAGVWCSFLGKGDGKYKDSVEEYILYEYESSPVKLRLLALSQCKSQ